MTVVRTLLHDCASKDAGHCLAGLCTCGEASNHSREDDEMRKSFTYSAEKITDPLLHYRNRMIQPAEQLRNYPLPLCTWGVHQAELEHLVKFQSMVDSEVEAFRPIIKLLQVGNQFNLVRFNSVKS